MPSRELVLAVISSSSSLSSPAQSRWFRPQSVHQSWTWRHSTGRSQSSPPTCLHPCQSPLWWPSSTPAPTKEQFSLAASSCTSATSPPTIFPACGGSSKCSWSPCPRFWSSQSFPFTPPAPGLSNHWSTTVANLLPAHSETTISTVSVRQVYHRTASNPWQVSFLLCVRTVNILKWVLTQL